MVDGDPVESCLAFGVIGREGRGGGALATCYHWYITINESGIKIFLQFIHVL